MTSEPTDELIARYDERGEVVGEVVRSVMRRENLWHAASSVVVRDPLGRIYLHRRTTTKDVYPGLLDFAAGGVVLAGEDPALGAVREAEEELGVHGVPLDPLGVVAYADEHTRYHAHRFTCRWDGPVRWQPEEVSWGDWVLVDELLQRVEAGARDVRARQRRGVGRGAARLAGRPGAAAPGVGQRGEPRRGSMGRPVAPPPRGRAAAAQRGGPAPTHRQHAGADRHRGAAPERRASRSARGAPPARRRWAGGPREAERRRW